MDEARIRILHTFLRHAHIVLHIHSACQSALKYFMALRVDRVAQVGYV